jgi:hypothetical protein
VEQEAPEQRVWRVPKFVAYTLHIEQTHHGQVIQH